MQGLRVVLLGEPKLSIDGRTLACASKKSLALFLYVALHPGRQSRRELARLLWGPGHEEAARTSLRSALQRLPRELAERLAVEREHIALLAPVDLDTRRFEALAAADDLDSLARAAELYGGPLLADFDVDAAPEFDDWLFRERARLLQLAQSVFDRLIAGHRARAHADQARAAAEREAAMAAARRWVWLDPSSETGHRWLIQLFIESGQREAATAQYEVCQRELAVAFGRGPDAETRAMVESLHAGATTRPEAPVASIATAVRAPELAGTSFVGRIDELAELGRLMAEPACRLLTLHGLGGAGKSRLAFALASQLGARHAQGATWVALGGVATGAQLASSVARALGINLPAQPEPAAALCNALRSQERLLVLDNFEHLVGDDAASDVILSLLAAAPRLKLLVTTREVLGLQEEWVYELGGLRCPATDAPAAAAGEFAAAELFIQRARQAYLGFSHHAEWPHVVRLCRITAGLPLALELAAAWVRTVPCADLVQAIDTEMTALAARHRNRPARQASLDAVVRTSWSLLSLEQRQVLAALSVFVEGFTNEAAQAVALAPLRVLSALGDKALVTRSEAGRLSLHPLVRQFAAAQAQRNAAEARLVRRRFAGFHAELLGRCRARLDGPEEIEAELTLSTELVNILAALEHWSDDGIAVDAIAEPLCRVLQGRGLALEARQYGDRFLAAVPVAAPATRSLVLALRGRAHASIRDMPASQADFAAAIELARANGLKHALAVASVQSLVVPFINDQLDLAERQLAELAPLVAELDDAVLAVHAHASLGMLFDASGRSEEAARSLSDAVQMARRSGSPMLVASMQSSLGGPLIKLGRFAEAEAALSEASVVLERTGSPHLARVLNTLSMLTLWRSAGAESGAAAKHAARSLDLYQRMGFDSGVSSAADSLGQALHALGRIDEAREQFRRAASVGGPIVEAEARYHLALLEAEFGDRERARELALEHLNLAQAHKLPVATLSSVLLACFMASREPLAAATARRWLRSVRAQSDLAFDQRRLVDAIWATLGGGADDGDTPAPLEELLPEVRNFLTR